MDVVGDGKEPWHVPFQCRPPIPGPPWPGRCHCLSGASLCTGRLCAVAWCVALLHLLRSPWQSQSSGLCFPLLSGLMRSDACVRSRALFGLGGASLDASALRHLRTEAGRVLARM
eukprot:5757483-Pyramimonas_sp.AAC.1